MLKVLDLFAGAGGMSYGFMQTGQFEVAVAVEIDPFAQQTYKKNHPTAVVQGDIKQINFKNLVTENGAIDIVIGGPPCQGFSNANRQRNQLISSNNQLVKTYVEAVLQVNPKVFVMENVGMLQSKTHRFFVTNTEKSKIHNSNISFVRERLELNASKVLAQLFFVTPVSADICRKMSIDPKDYGILHALYNSCSSYKRLSAHLSKHKSKIDKCIKRLLSRYSGKNDKVEETSYNALKELDSKLAISPCNITFIQKSLKAIFGIQKPLQILLELYKNDIDFQIDFYKQSLGVRIQTYSVEEYLLNSLGDKYHLVAGTLNANHFGVPQSRERYILLGILKELASENMVSLPNPIAETCPYNVRDAIEDLEHVTITTEPDWTIEVPASNTSKKTKYQQYVRDSAVIHNHITTESQDIALRRFAALEPGQNFHDLSDELKLETYSNVERTQNTIYKRLDYEKISGTVLNVRKSMWIHPTLNRAVSIREAARLQSFKDSFVFCGTKNSQYQQIGNAVPPLVARAIAEKVLELLGESPNERLVDII